ncbi:MXAN_6640 family putative metalloprotease [Hyalangium versicolor]|uniref:MXAN_6640 family putative metalloprotease n=1 Tax=Hyalangium versicolor TaxID=2861190 RepID=UPI001CCA5EA5|nr:MXAN_6640 family putative metalloprotease [Hyalangium versicolor]
MRLSALLLLLGMGCSQARPPHEELAVTHGALQAAVRPTDPSAPPPSFALGEAVESAVSPSGHFRLHFSRSGPNAVGAIDQDGNGVPDMVDTAARTYDQVESFYAGLGYRLPPDDAWVPGDHGGDGLFDVYLVDFAGRADGEFRLDGCLETDARCSGHMLQENDFAGYGYSSEEEAVAILASHEFFHAVQAAYRLGLGTVMGEGTAVWATERFRPELDDLEHFSEAYLQRPDRSLVLDPSGAAVSFTYGSAIFFQFLSERFGDELLLSLWEESVLAPAASWPELLETTLRRDWNSDFDAAFAEFAQWNLATGPRARAGQGYARGAGFPELTVAPATLPVDEPEVRVAPASTRYFEVAGGGQAVSAAFEPADGAAAESLHLVVSAVTNNAVLRTARADGPGTLVAEVPASDATHVVVAVVDGRHEGTGRYGRLCITGTSSQQPCVAVTPDTPGGGDDEGGCQAAPAGLAPALALVLLLTRRRRYVPSGLRSDR